MIPIRCFCNNIKENEMKFKPIGNRVLLKKVVDDEDQKTKGGLLLPDSAKDKQESFKVVEVSIWIDTSSDYRPPLNVGDIVLLERYSGQQVKIEGQTYFIVKTSDISAVLRNEE